MFQDDHLYKKINQHIRLHVSPENDREKQTARAAPSFVEPKNENQGPLFAKLKMPPHPLQTCHKIKNYTGKPFQCCVKNLGEKKNYVGCTAPRHEPNRLMARNSSAHSLYLLFHKLMGDYCWFFHSLKRLYSFGTVRVPREEKVWNGGGGGGYSIRHSTTV